MAQANPEQQLKLETQGLNYQDGIPYVDVVVGIRTDNPKISFTYSVPPDLVLQVGHQVRVPFGQKEVTGVVVALRAQTALDYTKPVSSLVYEWPVISNTQLNLAYWISENYLSPIYEVISMMMPPGLHLRNIQRISIRRNFPKPQHFSTEGAKRLYEYLDNKKGPLLAKTLEVRLGPWTKNALLVLGKENLLQFHTEKEITETIGLASFPKTNKNQEPTPLPTPSQSNAINIINSSIDSTTENRKHFLLKGVTGSGKTEVYIQAISHALSRGKQAVLLVPELSLTPQTLARFESRFPGNVIAFHSGLTSTQHRKNWWAIQNKQANVVIGSRSALFAPHHNLGIIVIDEEHEWTYKQQDQQPRYHARDVAFKLAELSNSVVLLGSATPDLSTYYAAEKGFIIPLELPTRIQKSGAPSSLANVEVVDMRSELKEGNRSIFSKLLKSYLIETYERGEQALLFLNRRGTANVVQCRTCGFALKCSRCNTSFNFHAPDKLVCHRCNKNRYAPSNCPKCKSSQIKYLGIGTQRVVDQVSELIPEAKILRWDRDSAKSIKDHESILSEFSSGKSNILVGTQMIAKGLDFPNVTFVGVILADIGLNSADLRSSERTFQVLTQVAGRAGRGQGNGNVVIQTYNPEHYAIRAAAKQNYQDFYDQEIQFRRSLTYPPFSQQIRLTLNSQNQSLAQREAQRVGNILRHEIRSWDIQEIRIIGPAPSIPSARKGYWSWNLTILGTNPNLLLEKINLPQSWRVDVDPY